MKKFIKKEDIKIGTRFFAGGKHKRECTVIDILDTYSRKTGEIVSTEYYAEHEFIGQKVKGTYPAPSVQRGFISHQSV